ncbi:FxsA family protein [Celeribacter arenosi]|uniref:Exlusion protein FxsA n=1 Tax=Celeribacter arenosi TaxID=792649 RepID=A0ABP7JXG6_9RHOB
MWLFALFVAIPIIEIALFIQVGGWIGTWPTLLIVIVTAILGTYLVRQQGSAALLRLRQSFSQLSDPTGALADGAMILFSGALLLTPGFFTDAVGFALLAPPVRRYIYEAVRSRVTIQTFDMGSGQGAQHRGERPAGGDVIDGEWREAETPETTEIPKTPSSGKSGWTRH